MKGIRGAITVDENTASAIEEATTQLMGTILEENQLTVDEIVNITFSATKDLDAAYPAKFVRSMGLVDAPLFCVQEMHVVGSLEKCLRVMILIERDKNLPVNHIYLKGAKVLRPDLLKG